MRDKPSKISELWFIPNDKPWVVYALINGKSYFVAEAGSREYAEQIVVQHNGSNCTEYQIDGGADMKSCPFCGASVICVETPKSHWQVFCPICDMGTRAYRAKEDVIAAWNCRAGELPL